MPEQSSTPNPRIAIFLPHLAKGGGGGAQRSMVHVANGLAARGWPVDLVLAEKVGPYLEEIKAPVRLVDLACDRVLSAVRPLRNYVRESRPACIVSTIANACFAAFVAGKTTKTRPVLVMRENNNLSQDSAHMGRERQAGLPIGVRFACRSMPWIYRHSDAVVAVSEGVAGDLAERFRVPQSKIEVLNNPVIGPDLYKAAEAPLEHPWFAPGAPPVVLAVGRLWVQKDYPMLFRAFKHLRTRREARLMILGEGPLRQELEALAGELGIGDEVALPGFDLNPFRYMKRAGVFAMSSAWEGLPGALIQALACGCPVVSTDCPSGPSEILDGGRFGRLVPVGDDAAFAEALREALDAPAPSPGLDAWLSRYSEEAAVGGYENLIRRLLDERA